MLAWLMRCTPLQYPCEALVKEHAPVAVRRDRVPFAGRMRVEADMIVNFVISHPTPLIERIVERVIALCKSSGRSSEAWSSGRHPLVEGAMILVPGERSRDILWPDS